MDGNVLPSKLINLLSKAADIVRSHDFIQVYTHYDADGISSASILANTLQRAGKEFAVTTLKTLDAETMDVIRECPADCMIIADIGASYIREIEEMGKATVILDHHTLRDDSEKVFYANPHIFGVDGMVGACGATMSFLFSIAYDEKNWDLVQIAFAGITGDKQHTRGLVGFNTYLLNEGEKRGFVKAIPGSLVPMGPVVKSLYASTEPYIRGISGNQSAILDLLKEIGMPADAQYVTLTDDERRKLSSVIAVKLTEQGTATEAMMGFTRTRYYLTGWKMDAEAMAELLDACGRKMMQGIGIAMCMGSKDDLLRANELRNEYNEEILNAVISLDAKGIRQMKNIQCIDCTETGYTGVLCGIVMQSFKDCGKPVIGIKTGENESTKISARATDSLLEKGVDLASALYLSAESVGGEGGGHRIASGGSIPPGSEETFLKNLDDIIGDQIKSSM